MRIRDVERRVEFITEDPAIIRKAQIGGKGYEIVTEETAIDARRKSLEGLKKDAVVIEAGKFNIAPDAFSTKAEFVEAILEAESAATTENAA
jgi:hypothetical protein